LPRNQTQRRLDIYVKSGPLLATGYTRLVVGGRGPYVEIHPSQLVREEVEIEPGEEYRLGGEWREKVFYAWYRTKVGHHKVYEQFKWVGYADYVPGYFYVSPDDVAFDGELYAEVSKQVAKKDDMPHIDFS
jgi:hypothetical protein